MEYNPGQNKRKVEPWTQLTDVPKHLWHEMNSGIAYVRFHSLIGLYRLATINGECQWRSLKGGLTTGRKRTL